MIVFRVRAHDCVMRYECYVLAMVLLSCGETSSAGSPVVELPDATASADAMRAEATSGAGTGGMPALRGASGAAAQPSARDRGRSGAAGAAERSARAGAGAAGAEADDQTAGAPAAGSGGSARSAASAADSGGSATPAANGCSRMLLSDTLDAYLQALAAHDPTGLPLASNAKFTENGATLDLGKAGLWTSAGPVRHKHSAFDVEQCTVATQAVVPEDGRDIPLALRIKLEQQTITEIETIAVRPGDYLLASDTDALSASAMSIHWEEPVPDGERNTRAELSAWMTKYFRMFPRGVCNTTSDCIRIENGGGSFNCQAGASCASGEPSPNDNALDARIILADTDTGIAVGFTMFQGNTDMHMAKMQRGEVHGVSAILARADSPGWP